MVPSVLVTKQPYNTKYYNIIDVHVYMYVLVHVCMYVHVHVHIHYDWEKPSNVQTFIRLLHIRI